MKTSIDPVEFGSALDLLSTAALGQPVVLTTVRFGEDRSKPAAITEYTGTIIGTSEEQHGGAEDNGAPLADEIRRTTIFLGDGRGFTIDWESNRGSVSAFVQLLED